MTPLVSHYIDLGVRRENIVMCDTKGVIFEGRKEGMNSYKARYASKTEARTLAGALVGADVFFGLSSAGAVTPEMVLGMAPDPVIFALANPDPEIAYDLALATRPDAIVATGRSDYPNQVNNVLGFPFIFRGALDVRATTINDHVPVLLGNRVSPTELPAAAGSGRHRGVARRAARLHLRRRQYCPLPRVRPRIVPANAPLAQTLGRPMLDRDCGRCGTAAIGKCRGVPRPVHWHRDVEPG
jgi:malate dehydrogenase (oxaloacetate-decarboxylating)(NADP+)